MSLLDRIEQPSDLDHLSIRELETLSEEIREFLLEKISKTGGHLSANLGIVELTIALHRVFDSPRDRLLWDVGHQSYVHKILTGRKRGFDRLRQFGGMSGYPDRSESEHDFVESSHASTSLSYAIGHAMSNPDYFTIAVIGDGALTGGVAYEALNHIAVTRPSKLVIVVNDNGRSYDPTIGGLAMLANLSHLRLDPRYEWAKQTTGRVLRGLPIVGDTADELAMRFKEAVKQMLEPSTVFDTLGLKYTGRIDGHDIALLEETLERAKHYHEPVVVHVVTEKGNGYQPAIDDVADKLHRIGTFDVSTGKAFTSELSLTDVAGRCLADIASRNEAVVGISAAMISSTGLGPMAERFPDRVIDTGIAEQHSVALAAGLAMAGKHPVVAIHSSFLQRAFDQIVTDVALHDLPVTFLVDRAGVTGPDGPSHHGVFDLSYLRLIPNLVIAIPTDAGELCAMIQTGVDHEGPFAIRYPKASATSLPSLPVDQIGIGEWEELSAGQDVLFLANGRFVEVAQKVASSLDQSGLSCGVVNARWVKPLDERLEDWISRYRLTVTIEDNVLSGGFGAAVMERLAGTPLAGRVHLMGIPDDFLPFGSASEVLDSVGLSADSIAERTGLLLAD